MIQLSSLNIQKLVLHNVGNKFNDDGMLLSKKELIFDDLISALLSKYFSNSFKIEQLYRFYNDVDISFNEVNGIASSIFDNPECMYEQSINLAKHLYEKSNHPKVKGGDFYVVYFKGCIIDGKTVDAIGLFKSENKDIFLKVYPSGDSFEIESQQGVNINKLDKGCLIFNTDKENGYMVAVVDNTNKGTEARYWIDNFLHIRHRKDSYNQTQNMLSICKNFISKHPDNNGKINKVILMNRSVEALKNNSVNIESFAENVFKRPELVSGFKQFKENYQKEREIEIDETFTTDLQAIKRKATGSMTTIKLDKNFDINIHGGEQYIERGYDERRGLNYYQLFFKEEK